MEKKEGRKEGEKPPLEWKRLETGNRITPEFLTRRIPAGCSRNLSEGIIRKRSRRERERGRLEKPEEDWNGNSSGRTNGTMKFTRQRRFFFHFHHFQNPRIPFDSGFGSKTPGSRMSRLPRVLVETGNLRSYSRSSSLHERLDSSKRLGQDPDPTAGFFVRGVRTRRERAAACLGAGGN